MLVQFGNNWIQKIPWTAKLDSASSNLAVVLGIFVIQLFPNWTACSPITYMNWSSHAKLLTNLRKIEKWPKI